MPTKPSLTPRKLLHLAHLWLGLILCVPLVLLGLTGTILVFEKDFQPAGHTATGTPQPIAAIIAAAAKMAPEHQKASAYNPPSEENAMASVRFPAGGREGGQRGGGQGGPGGFGAQIPRRPGKPGYLGGGAQRLHPAGSHAARQSADERQDRAQASSAGSAL